MDAKKITGTSFRFSRVLGFACASALSLTVGVVSASAQPRVTYEFSYSPTEGPIQPFTFQTVSSGFIPPGTFALTAPFSISDGAHQWTMTQAEGCNLFTGLGEFTFASQGSHLNADCTAAAQGGQPAVFLMILNTGPLPTSVGTYVSGGPIGSVLKDRVLILAWFADPAGPFGFRQVTARGTVTLVVSQGLASPTNLRATQSGTSGNQIQLTWDYGTDPIDGFKIYRQKASDTTWSSATPVATIPVGSAPYGTTDPVPVAYGTYTYRVTAYKETTESDPSEEDTAFQISYGTDDCIELQGQTLCTGITTPLLPGGHGGNKLIASFKPDDSASLSQVAHNLGFDHFNWISLITHDVVPLFDINGQPLPIPHEDPPIGGYFGHPADSLSYYFEETCGSPIIYCLSDNEAGGNQNISHRAIFFDVPFDPRIAQTPGAYISFSTTLVGVRTGVGVTPTDSEELAEFAWDTTNTGSLGGVGLRSNGQAPDYPGTGGVINIRLVPKRDIPDNVRTLLRQAGVNGIPANAKVDRDAPATANVLSGFLGANGWYTDPITVTLIPTDIDGPNDIASTSYSVDGALAIGYQVPFTIFSEGTHTIGFRSVDKAGNVETVKSVTFMLDSTPPTITASRSIQANANGWNNSAVTISFQCSDALSGLAGSLPAPVTLSANGANQPATGMCSDVAGNTAALIVQPINIDLAPPTVTVNASRSTLWPPNGGLVPDTMSGVIADDMSGIDLSTAAFSVIDEYGQVQPSGPITLGSGGAYSFTVNLEASRLGQDLDGRHYQIIVRGRDRAGNLTSASTIVTVLHDQQQ